MVRRIWIASIAALVAIIGLTAVSSVSAKPRPFTTGVTVADVGPSQELLGFQRIRQAGARFTRVSIYWSIVAPAKKPANWDPTDPADPNYDWSTVDSHISNAIQAGLTPLVQIHTAPAWAERCKGTFAGICDPDPVAFARFTRAAAERFSGNFGGLPRVRYWQPLNEPNLNYYFQPQVRNGRKVSPALYRNLLNRFSGVVKAVDSSNLVVAGGLSPLKRPGGLGPLDFARRVFCMQGRKKPTRQPGCKAVARFDIWSTNPYTTGGPTHASAGIDDVSLGDLPEMSRLLKAAKRAGKIRTPLRQVPFWATEFSWDSAPPDPGGVPMGLLTRWTAEAMFRSWQAGVTKFFWLTLRDWERDPRRPYNETIEAGLYFRGATVAKDRPKRVLKAFRFPFVAFRANKGISVWGRTPQSTSGKVVLWYRNGGGWRRIGTTRASSDGVFRALVRTRLGKNRRGQVRATYGSQQAVPFGLRPVKDRYQPPFGGTE